ncbi:MAG: class I tRNA ligase family protein, partial [Planctomycetaceae bacterium]|nr:class I tRNA ligase family protein [Planctomycetaceae bacterium]
MSFEFTPESLPKNFDHKQASQRTFDRWSDSGYFHADPESDKPAFSIVIPPPNVTGALHLGHALNSTLQDILVRMRRMQGFEVLWMPGTDHAGIATQAVVERRLREEEGLSRHDLGREALVERIWEWKGQYEKRIISQLKQLGSSCDWDRTRFTLDAICARAVRHTFFDLFKKSYIYRGKRLVNWDTFLQTAVSDDEVFHEVVEGHFWHFRYAVIDPQLGEPTHVTIATTRPETMLGDTAVAVHPDPDKAFEKLIANLESKISEAADADPTELQTELDRLRERQVDVLSALEQLRDMAVAGRMLQLPLMDREIPLVVDVWAKPELGSGCVKITPAHDPNDYEVGQRQSLPMINVLCPDGTLNANAGTYQGQTMSEARKNIVADLEALGLMGEIEDREIDLAHSDRSKTPIEPCLADQWFVKMDVLAQSAMDAVTGDQVQIFPKRYRRGYLDWLGEKRDWPVSRQLWWGHQIPIWSRHCETEEDLQQQQETLNGHVQIQAGGVAYQVEFTAVQNEATRTDATQAETHFAVIHVGIEVEDSSLEAEFEALGYQREEDVLDTWFSSALWPHSTLSWPDETPELAKFYPSTTLITSRDIITLWVARMVLMGLNNLGEVPFSEVFIHPKILDGYGETMSKSKGNGVDPLDVIEKFGADALRFGLAYLTTETQDVRMPVQFECPHCASSIEQTKKNRELPRVKCPQCAEEFHTQWARNDEDLALPRGAVLSERFEISRNFCTKLWNASRFTLMNLSGYEAAEVAEEDLAFEDRWILSRLSSVTQQVTEKLEHYGFAEATRVLYDFAWDEFCSFYIEMTKSRMQDDSSRAVAQRVTAYTLDQLLRLLHPIIPFVTEEVWGLLSQIAPQRGLSELAMATESIMLAEWPVADCARIHVEIEQQFSQFQEVLRAVREIRSRQNIAPRDEIEFSIHCSAGAEQLLRPLEGYFESMANARCVAWGESVEAPENSASVRVGEMEVFVDLK